MLGEIGTNALCTGRVECLLTFLSRWGPGDFSGGRVWALRVLEREERMEGENPDLVLGDPVDREELGGAEGCLLLPDSFISTNIKLNMVNM